MKKIFLFCLIITLLILPVYAENPDAQKPLFCDRANLIESNGDSAAIENMLQSIKEKFALSIVILTVDDMDGYAPEGFADSYYHAEGYPEDGLIFMLSMAERDWAVVGQGEGEIYFPNFVIDEIMADTLAYLGNDDYFTAFTVFVELCGYYRSEEYALSGICGGQGDDQYGDYGDSTYGEYGGTYGDDLYTDRSEKYEFPLGKYMLISIFAGLIIGLITVLVMRSQLKSVRFAKNAAGYIESGSFKLTESRDLFLYSTLSKTPRQQSRGGGTSVGGGGFSGGASRGFSGGSSRSGRF